MEGERRPAGAPAEPRGPAGAPSPDQPRPTGNPAPPGDPAAPGREAEEAAGSYSEEAVGGNSEAAGSESENAAASVQHDLDELLEETKRERDEYLDLARRTKADFENYRKRMSAETAAAARRGKAGLAAELIGVIDNLERALVAAGIDPAAALSEEETPEEPLAQGIVLTYRELNSVLRKAGAEPYDPKGEQFDPAWHEALQTRPGEGAEPGTVVEVLQKGYRLDGQVIRAARVVVSE
jgi:molecular chaperone GrpE